MKAVKGGDETIEKGKGSKQGNKWFNPLCVMVCDTFDKQHGFKVTEAIILLLANVKNEGKGLR